jgi:hypothetical protein
VKKCSDPYRGPTDGNKTVRHQDISAPVEKDSSAPRHFGTVEKDSSASRKFGIRTNRHRIFFQTNVITISKIKSTKVKKKPINDRLNAIKA